MYSVGRYEYSDAKSNKYWEVVFDNTDGTFTVFWGRIGASPQVQENQDLNHVVKKINEKVAKGYKFVGLAFSCGEYGAISNYDSGEIDIHGAFMPFSDERMGAKARVGKKREDKKDAMDFMKELKKI